jgi:DnaJ-class molecular chaperone
MLHRTCTNSVTVEPQTPMHIWETNCKKCSGTGTVASYRGGRGRGGRGARRLLYTCPTCHGVGELQLWVQVGERVSVVCEGEWKTEYK